MGKLRLHNKRILAPLRGSEGFSVASFLCFNGTKSNQLQSRRKCERYVVQKLNL